MTRPRSSSAAEELVWARQRQENFLIVGFTGRTGRSVATVFEKRGITYKVSDLRSRRELEPDLAGLALREEDVFCGPQGAEQLAGITKIILSPGVPRSIPLIREAKRRNIPVLGDVDFLYEFVKRKRIVAITGTDGKTTTTLLTAGILGASGRVVAAGNMGEPVFARYNEILACDYLVLELSSFMLEDIQEFRPSIAAITNIAQDHVDRYGSKEEYLAAKLGVARHCALEDLFIHNLDDPVLGSCVPEHLRVRTVSRLSPKADYLFTDGRFFFKDQALAYKDCLLRGVHNIENILIALAIGCEAGVDPGQAAEAVRNFRAVPHRFQYLGSYQGVEVYDDSKATTVHAVERALESLSGDVVLIVGGREKDLDFSPLKKHAAKIKLLMCYGEAGERIDHSLRLPRSDYVFGFEEAVRRAIRACGEGDHLLLSPGCTSWDQHPDYGVRGMVFRDLVLQAWGPPRPGDLSTRAAEASRRNRPAPSGRPEAQGSPFRHPPRASGLQFGSAYRCAPGEAQEGGSLCELFEVGEGRVVVALGDVWGPRAEAAGLARATAEAIRSHNLSELALPHLILERLGKTLFHRLRAAASIVHLVIGLFDTEEGNLRYAIAGQSAPLLISTVHSPFFLAGAGRQPLGVDPGTCYATRGINLGAEARLVLYTGGVTETSNGKSSFGTKGLQRAARRNSGATVEALPGLILAELERFAARELRYDICLLALQLDGHALPGSPATERASAPKLGQAVW